MNAERPTVLVVDDEPEVLRSVHDLFRRDFRIHTFEHGAEALALLEREEADVVLSDQRMPDMCGVELLRQAERLRPETTRMLFTGYTDIKAVIEAINLGHIFRYIAKPWDPEELTHDLGQAVAHRRLLAERRRLVAELRTANASLEESNARLTEANRLKCAFIEVASHELNTPVAVVLGLAELWKIIQAPNATPVERAWVDRVQAAGKRLAHTVERMFKLVEADRFSETLELRSTELAPLVSSAVEQVEPFLAARGQRIEINVDPEIGSAEIDAEKVADILTNLLANAIKFSPDRATIRLAARSAGADRIEFEVADQGVGIRAEEQPHLFEPFFTGFDTLNHSSGDYQFRKRGMGLGLPLVRSFIELHGGTIDVQSEPGAGSLFRVSMRRRPRANSGFRDGP